MGKDIELGKRIAWLRINRGLEQKPASEKLDILYTTYQKYEYGNPPSRKNINKILNYYACSKSWLLTGEGVPYPTGDQKASTGPVYIKEGQAAWTADGAAQKINIDEAWGKTYKVLKSGSPYAVALYLNIQQFSGALDATQELHVCQDRITNLETEVHALRRQMNALTAPPTGADQHAVSLEKEAM